MNVVVSGLTAAGKTTHCRLLADHLGFDYVSASSILKGMMSDATSTDYWKTEWDDERSSGRLDRKLDERMVYELEKRDDTVFDAWALPWTSTAPAIRIWLESDELSRASKVVVSRLRVGETMVVDEGLAIAQEKDDTSHRIFQDHHGFDLFTDRSVFDLTFDLSGLIETPSIRASDIGIGCAAAVIHATVDRVLGVPKRDGGLTDFQRAILVDDRTRSS